MAGPSRGAGRPLQRSPLPPPQFSRQSTLPKIGRKAGAWARPPCHAFHRRSFFSAATKRTAAMHRGECEKIEGKVDISMPT